MADVALFTVTKRGWLSLHHLYNLVEVRGFPGEGLVKIALPSGQLGSEVLSNCHSELVGKVTKGKTIGL